MSSSPRGPRWADAAPPAPRPPPEEDMGTVGDKVDMVGMMGMVGVISNNVDSPEDVGVICANVDSPSPVSRPVSYTADKTSCGSELSPQGKESVLKQSTLSPLSPPVQAGMTTEQMVAVSPARRRDFRESTRAKISEMSERLLDTHTTELYKWGEPR